MVQMLRGEAPGCSPLIQRGELFYKYVEELDAIDPSTSSRRRPARQYFMECLESTYNFDMLTNASKRPTALWVDLYPESKSTPDPIGFLLISVDPKITGKAHYCIQEAYVLPDFRNHGVMTAAISKIFHSFPASTALLYVLNANTYARTFWTRLFESHGFTPEIVDCGDGFSELTFRPANQSSP